MIWSTILLKSRQIYPISPLSKSILTIQNVVRTSLFVGWSFMRRIIMPTFQRTLCWLTVCPRSSDPIYKVTCNMTRFTTSWTDCMLTKLNVIIHTESCPNFIVYALHKMDNTRPFGQTVWNKQIFLCLQVRNRMDFAWSDKIFRIFFLSFFSLSLIVQINMVPRPKIF